MKIFFTKKLLKNSLFMVPLVTTFICCSCSKINEEKKIVYTKTFKEKINSNILELAQKIYSDKNELNSFLTIQSQINKSFDNEIKNSLVLAPLWDTFVKDNAGDKINRTTKAITNISNFLNENWFWYLNNLNKLSFVFNPYGNYYDSSVNNEEFEKNIDNKFTNNTILINLKNSYISKIHTFDLSIDNYDVLLNKKLLFLELTNNQFLLLLYYEKNNQRKIFIIPDLLKINSSNISNILEAFVTKFNEAKNELDLEEKNYWEKLKENDDTVNFDFEKYLKEHNDQYIFTPYKFNNYQAIFKKIIEKINTNENLIEKYTWGYLNEI
ncbi:hypothetical protein ASB56_01380 [Mycoplasmopsis meleagridis]|nr:hypothetical protein ASB56_01380 [Mycoplasmopsis meleagridis]